MKINQKSYQYIPIQPPNLSTKCRFLRDILILIVHEQIPQKKKKEKTYSERKKKVYYTKGEIATSTNKTAPPMKSPEIDGNEAAEECR